MGLRPRLTLLTLGLAAAWLCTAPPAAAQVPGEVADVVRLTPTRLGWSAVSGATSYSVYGGTRTELLAGVPAKCEAHPVVDLFYETRTVPPAGGLNVYLVTASNSSGEEGPVGVASNGEGRALYGSCDSVVRRHAMNRAGYGWSESIRDRIAALGIDGYLTEQLDPSSIDESANAALNSRLAALEPPANAFEFLARQMVRAVYSERQLEQVMAMFWANHFNTANEKVTSIFFGVYPQCFDPPSPQCDPNYPEITLRTGVELQRRELDQWRSLAFGGSFRQMLEASALSPAMIIFLDTLGSVAGAPNENYPRELLELYSLGVSGGYTQNDVEELARVFTGWSLCRRDLADVGNPIAACQTEYWIGDGQWTAAFDFNNHDCTAKTLFAGTLQEATIPDTCGDPLAGRFGVGLALDAIAAHPSTKRFISGKILELLVDDTVEESWIDALVAEWDDPSNPAGIGDMGQVTAAALALPEFHDPLRARRKVKTPFEHLASAIRSTDGRTDGLTLDPFVLLLLQHLPFQNPVPTGYPERGSAWIDTNNSLHRQNFGIYLVASADPNYGVEYATLLADNGISTAPGNEQQIVDFFAEILFGGAWTPAERQQALDYLLTDDFGNPAAAYDLGRIYQLGAYMMGYPAFQEQ